MQRLYLELTSLENRGITIWLEGAKSSSQDVASQLCVQEESTYMRDYIFDEGVLKEVHFDKIRKDLPVTSRNWNRMTEFLNARSYCLCSEYYLIKRQRELPPEFTISRGRSRFSFCGTQKMADANSFDFVLQYATM